MYQNIPRLTLSARSAQIYQARHTKSGEQRLQGDRGPLQTLSADIKTEEEKLHMLNAVTNSGS